MAKVKKIRKWDEVTGNAVEEQIPESIDPIEDVGAGPSMQLIRFLGKAAQKILMSCFINWKMIQIHRLKNSRIRIIGRM